MKGLRHQLVVVLLALLQATSSFAAATPAADDQPQMGCHSMIVEQPAPAPTADTDDCCADHQTDCSIQTPCQDAACGCAAGMVGLPTDNIVHGASPAAIVGNSASHLYASLRPHPEHRPPIGY